MASNSLLQRAGKVVLGGLLAAVGLPAQAQDGGVDETPGWRFSLTPYVWFTGIEGDIGAVGGLPPAAVDADFADLIENADLAFMLASEARHGRLGVVLDLSYLGLSADGATPGPLFGGADVESTTFFSTAAGFYQLVAGQHFSLDVLAGARLWYVDTQIDLSAGVLPAARIEDDEVWADPVVGLRWHGEVGHGFYVAGAADIGGFGIASDSTWQLLGTLGYRFSDRLSVRAGYRHLAVDYESGGFVWDVELSGPIAGLTWRF